MTNNIYDVIIIGGGYSGCVLAYYLNKEKKVLVVENNKSILKKFLISGKGYSNIANTLPKDEFIKNIIDNNKFLYSAISKYSYRDILSWCDELNIKYEEKTKHRIHLIDSNEKFRTYLLNEFEKFPN
ncbi:MAG: FAD-dependent oxidoreductase, partial [Mycoplasma sp.]